MSEPPEPATAEAGELSVPHRRSERGENEDNSDEEEHAGMRTFARTLGQTLGSFMAESNEAREADKLTAMFTKNKIKAFLSAKDQLQSSEIYDLLKVTTHL
jgi:hypothetical protein